MGIYHPPPGNSITNATFIDKITELLANRITKYNNMMILGDLNIHIDDLSNTDSHMFNDAMQAFGFKQHVTSPTYKCRHTLDLICSKINTELTLHNCIVHGFILDHTLVTTDTILRKAPRETTEKTIRDTKLTRENKTTPKKSLIVMLVSNKHAINSMRNCTKCLIEQHPRKK